MPWFHGTPDVRALRDHGFRLRSEPVRAVRNMEALRAARRHASEEGISDLEAFRRMDAISAHFEDIEIPVPVFLAASRATAASYANDHRAFDYQNAEPAVLEVEVDGEPDLVIDAGGATFRGLAWARIEAGIHEIGRDPREVGEILENRLQRDITERIRVSDLGRALHLCGYRVVEVRNVVDTHDGKGHPDTVRMVFDPDLLRLSDPHRVAEGWEP
ncbi:hypothetical protein LAZ40_07215 [Cereibacter sphaeroides]|uniref:hypothetical protein n=1 Tax=Cereibacter sphaeroides TaxID=1063 RepID=UPI001F240EA9|nr:hypothetical protein [Cereibacter sphaeroides]MCE6958837.1 hypothetical protein [Cereibacter sphaeroides]MCE6973289.1 hypothetical protein [Cereibacter sphaeroides]